MNVPLDPNDQRKIEELARSAGKDPGELLRELLHKAIAEYERTGEAHADAGPAPSDLVTNREDTDGFVENDSGAWQLEVLDELIREADLLPAMKHADGLSGSMDHDEILYGGRSKMSGP